MGQAAYRHRLVRRNPLQSESRIQVQDMVSNLWIFSNDQLYSGDTSTSPKFEVSRRGALCEQFSGFASCALEDKGWRSVAPEDAMATLEATLEAAEAVRTG